jgi:hypothetical protein
VTVNVGEGLLKDAKWREFDFARKAFDGFSNVNSGFDATSF